MRLKGVGRVLSDSRTGRGRRAERTRELPLLSSESIYVTFRVLLPSSTIPYDDDDDVGFINVTRTLSYKCAPSRVCVCVWACVNKNTLAACLMASSTRERLHLSYTTRGEHAAMSRRFLYGGVIGARHVFASDVFRLLSEEKVVLLLYFFFFFF